VSTWSDEAACGQAVTRGQAHPDDWFPDGVTLDDGHRAAIALCGVCPVRKECHDTALRTTRPSVQGIWAGYTETQRDAQVRVLARRQRRVVARHEQRRRDAATPRGGR